MPSSIFIQVERIYDIRCMMYCNFKYWTMTGKDGTYIIRILLCFLILLLFPCNSIFCQTDTLVMQKQVVKENSIDFENERFSLGMGFFYSADNTGITLGSKQAGLGIVYDIEDALGLKTSSFVFRGNANFKFGRRHRSAVVLNYFGINRKATKTLEADLELGDITYPIGTKLDSKFNLAIIRAKYEYTFLQDDRVSLGFSAGLYIIPLSFSVKSGSSEEQSTAFIAPLPVFGLRSDFLITNRLVLKESAELLYLKIHNFSGSILDLKLAAEYRAFKHFGFGIGINSNKLSIAAKGEEYPSIDFFGTIKMDYTGAFLSVNYYL
jgi:hypothetical protein